MVHISGMTRCLILFVIFSVASINSPLAQYLYPKLNEARLILERPLAVQLLPEETEVEEAMNIVLKEAFTEDYNGEVVFMTPDEIKDLKRQKSNNYAFLIQRESLSEEIRYGVRYVDGSLLHWVMGTSGTGDPVAENEINTFAYSNVPLLYYDFILSVFDGKKEKVASVFTFINDELGKHDYLYLCQQIDILVKSSTDGIMRADFVDVPKNIERLKSVKSYYLSDYFEDEVIGSFGDYYEYDFEVVSFKDYLSVILEKRENAAYIKTIFSYQHNRFMWLMVDASNGQILALNDIGDYKFTGNFNAKNLIKPRHLKYSVHEPTQLLNNYYNK